VFDAAPLMRGVRCLRLTYDSLNAWEVRDENIIFVYGHRLLDELCG
jgi:hypothetical protein